MVVIMDIIRLQEQSLIQYSYCLLTCIPSWYYNYNTLYVKGFRKKLPPHIMSKEVGHNNSIKITILTYQCEVMNEMCFK